MCRHLSCCINVISVSVRLPLGWIYVPLAKRFDFLLLSLGILTCCLLWVLRYCFNFLLYDFCYWLWIMLIPIDNSGIVLILVLLYFLGGKKIYFRWFPWCVILLLGQFQVCYFNFFFYLFSWFLIWCPFDMIKLIYRVSITTHFLEIWVWMMNTLNKLNQW